MSTAWETIGALVLFMFVPIHSICIPWYWYRRRHYPIVGRAPGPLLWVMIVMTPTMAFLGYLLWKPSFNPPCWLSWYFVAALANSFLHATTLRATLLLCESEVNADLVMAEKTRAAKDRYAVHPHHPNHHGSGGGAHHHAVYHHPHPYHYHQSNNLTSPNSGNGGGLTPGGITVRNVTSHSDNDPNPSAAATPATAALRHFRPSWWTKHRKTFRDHRFLWRVLGITVAINVIVDSSVIHLLIGSSVTAGCYESHALYTFRTVMFTMQGVLLSPFFVLLCIVLWQLRRHHQDGFGLRTELKFVAFGTFVIFTVSGILSSTTKDKNYAAIWFTIVTTYIILWLLSCVHPIYVTYNHQDMMTHRLATLTKVTTLQDLLAIPDGYECFLNFCRREFTSESVLFWRRVIDFRASIATLMAFDVNYRSHLTTNHLSELEIGGGISSLVTADVANTERAQQSLLAALIEANGIYSYYIDQFAPNELRLLSLEIRRATRATIDSYLFRAATHQHQFVPAHAQLTGRQSNSGSSGPNGFTGLSGLGNIGHDTTQTTNNPTTTTNDNNNNNTSSIDGGGKNTHDGAASGASTITQATSDAPPSQPQTARPSVDHDPASSLTTSVPVATTTTSPVVAVTKTQPSSRTLHALVTSSMMMSPSAGHQSILSSPSSIPYHSTAVAPEPPSTTMMAATTVTGTTTTATGGTTNGAAATTSDDLLRMVPSLHTIAIAPSVPVRVITKKGVSVSTHYTVDEAHELELEVRTAFNPCLDIITAHLQVNSFARFRASDAFTQLISGYHGLHTSNITGGHDRDGGRGSVTPPNAMTPRQALGIIDQPTTEIQQQGTDGGNGSGENMAMNDDTKSIRTGTRSLRNATIAPTPLHILQAPQRQYPSSSVASRDEDDGGEARHSVLPSPSHGGTVSGIGPHSANGGAISPQYPPVSHHLRGFISSGGNSVLGFGPQGSHNGAIVSRIGGPSTSSGLYNAAGRTSIIGSLLSGNSSINGHHHHSHHHGNGHGSHAAGGAFGEHSVTPSAEASSVVMGFGGGKLVGHTFLSQSQHSLLGIGGSVPNSPPYRGFYSTNNRHISPLPGIGHHGSTLLPGEHETLNSQSMLALMIAHNVPIMNDDPERAASAAEAVARASRPSSRLQAHHPAHQHDRDTIMNYEDGHPLPQFHHYQPDTADDDMMAP